MGRYEKFFNQIAQDLDLTDTEYNTIVGSYEAVGKFLTNSDELKKYNPEVFPQGSVRLGTVVKPLKKDDYDVDLVCELNASNLSAREVKQNVGNVLKNSRYLDQLEKEHGRCWTLDYNAKPPYHLDILPGVSLPNGRIKATNYINNEYKWLYTNPKGFAKWFLSLKKPTLNERFNDSVEPIKDYSGKTVLQRAVQLLKRHRDVYFKDNPDDGPASVIITALTGLSYNSESTIEDILKNGPIQWISHIGYKDKGLSIKIPSLPDDDYADKWNEEGDKPVNNFLKWHQQLISDLDNLFKESNYSKFMELSKRMFTDSSVDKISNNNVRIMDSLRESFDKQYPMIIQEQVHPLFKHAKLLPQGAKYLPASTVFVKVVCRVYNDEASAEKYSDNYEEEFYDYSPILRKGKHLAFKAIIRTNDKLGYHIKWQVTNTGKEAMLAKEGGQLRGNFTSEDESNLGEYIHTESTLYAGTHFIQCFVFRWKNLNGKIYENCVSKSRLVAVNIGATE